MQILVLDSIHGGDVIGDYLTSLGHQVDVVDVYRDSGDISPGEAAERRYDLLISPVHLDPSYFLLRSLTIPRITHHEAVRWILGMVPGCIEITGKQGKTTTAVALSSLLPGNVILQSSAGLFRYPEREIINRLSITPASLLTARTYAGPDDWLVGEISLGFCGIGDLAILTSGDDYPVAGGKKQALRIKEESALVTHRLLVPPGVRVVHDNVTNAEDLVTVSGDTLTYRYNGLTGCVSNPILMLPGYRTALQLAAAAALLLGYSPDKLADFSSLPGRMEVKRENGTIWIDNSNSGVCIQTACDAVSTARLLDPSGDICLIIGQEASSVCENYPTGDIITTLSAASPRSVILVAGDPHIEPPVIRDWCTSHGVAFAEADTLEDARKSAEKMKYPLIICSVKTWR